MNKLIPILAFYLISPFVFSDTSFTADVNKLRVGTSSQVIIYMDENDPNTTDSVENDVCRYASEPDNKFNAKFQTDTDGGKAMLSVALSAQARGVPVYMNVTDNCQITFIQVK